MMKSRTIIGVSKKMQTAVRHLAYPLLLIILIISCDREPLELYMQGDSLVNIDQDWSIFGTKPENISVLYFKDGDSLTQKEEIHIKNIENGINHDDLRNGNYKMIFMTNTNSDYEVVMDFYDVDNYDSIRVQSKYSFAKEGAWDEGMRYMDEPIALGVAIDSINIERENDGMIFYEYDKRDNIGTKTDSVMPTVWPMTTKMTIWVKVRGINYILDPSLGGVEGYITGMANGCWLSSFWRSTEVGNLKLTNWQKGSGYSRNTTRAGDREDGWIYAEIQTFGLPHGREWTCQRSEQSNFLKLHFISLDPVKFPKVEFSYNVGKMLRYSNDTNSPDSVFKNTDCRYPLELKICEPDIPEDQLPTMPYAQPEGTGQFDAQVEDWGDDQNVDVPM